MLRRALLRASAGLGLATIAGAAVTGCAGRTSAPSRPFRVGVLHLPPAESKAEVQPAFREAIRESGLVEGQDLTYEFRYAGRPDRMAATAEQLVESRPDLILAPTHVAAAAAKVATQDIPIVMIQPYDAAETGLVASLARPGGNITGTTMVSLTLMQKRVELLLEVAPRTARVAYLTTLAPPITDVAREAFEEALRTRGLQPQVLPIREASEIEAAFGSMVTGSADALFVLETTVFAAERARIAELSVRHAIPSIAGERQYAEAGALLSYGVVYADLHRRAGFYVAKILRGAKPAELPVEAASRFELVLNSRTATALGITFPPSLLARADALI